MHSSGLMFAPVVAQQKHDVGFFLTNCRRMEQEIYQQLKALSAVMNMSLQSFIVKMYFSWKMKVYIC